MSDTAQGPGWWQADDDLWYPPEEEPGPEPEPEPPGRRDEVPLAPPPMTISRRLAWVVVVLLLLGGVFALVLELSSGHSPAAAPGTAAAGAASGTPAQQALLAALGVRQSDVAPGVVVSVIPGGDQLTQPTLNLCNASFPSERQRVARRQVVAVNPAGNGLNTEAVLYSSPVATAEAFSELTTAAAHCPPVFRRGSVPGSAATKVVLGPAPDSAWPATPGVTRQAYAYTVTAKNGQGGEFVNVYLRRGPLLLGIYFVGDPGSAQTAVGGRTSMEGITELLARRLAAAPLPASA